MNVLEVHDLYKGFGGVQAVAGVSFGVAEGEALWSAVGISPGKA